MELQIQDLVESIKRDGIAEAEKQAERIMSEAKEKADELVRNATKEAQRITDDAKKDAAVLKQSGIAAVEQAARDVMLSLRKRINAQFERLLEETVSKTLSSKELVELIVSVVHSDMVTASSSTVQVNQDQMKKLGETLQKQLEKELKQGLEIRPVESVDVGFRIASKDGSSYYDFSAEEIARMLSPFLNATVQEILASATDVQ